MLLLAVRNVVTVVQCLLTACEQVNLLLLLPILLDLDHAVGHVDELKVRTVDWIGVTLGRFFLRSLLVVVAFEVVQIGCTGCGEIDAVAQRESCCSQFHVNVLPLGLALGAGFVSSFLFSFVCHYN